MRRWEDDARRSWLEARVRFAAAHWLLWGPLLSFGVVGVLALLLRWTFSRGHSLVQAPPRRGHADEYGLLVSVAAPATMTEAQVLAERLRAAGIRATAALTEDGPQLLVFEQDWAEARRRLQK